MTKEEEKELINLWKNKTKNQKIISRHWRQSNIYTKNKTTN